MTYQTHSDAGYTEEQRKRMVWERDNYLPEVLRGIKIKNATDEQNQRISRVNAYIAEATAETDIALKGVLLDKANAEVDKLKEDKKFVEKNGNYLDALARTENELRDPRRANIDEHTEDLKDTREARKTSLFAGAANARSQSDLNEQEYDFLDWFNQFKKDNAVIDKWFERGLTASEIVRNLVDSYYKYRNHGDSQKAAAEKNKLEYLKLFAFVARYFI